MYSNSKDQISLEQVYRSVHSDIVEEDVMDLVNKATSMIDQAWQVFGHAKTYEQLSTQDKAIIDTFWTYMKALGGLFLYFGLGYPVVDELIKMANNFFKVKNKRSVSFSDYLNSIKEKIVKLNTLKDSGVRDQTTQAEAERVLNDIKNEYTKNHNDDVEARISQLP